MTTNIRDIAAESIDKRIIPPDTSLIRVIEMMSVVNDKAILVADQNRCLLGLVTDYDIRHAILRHLRFEQPVSEFMTARPIIAAADATDVEVVELMQRHNLTCVPLVDSEGRVITIRFLREFTCLVAAPKRHQVAVVMAGGFGSRLLPLTERMPKPLLRVDGKPILFILLDQILNEGFDQVYLTLHYRSEDIIRAVNQLSRYRDRIQFVVEPQPMGTAGALARLPVRPQHPFLVMNADLLTEVPMQELLRYHLVEDNVVTVATKLETYDVPYGVVDLAGSQVIGFREKPTYKMFINTGIYVFDPSALDLVEPGEMLQMNELMERLIANGARVGSFPVHEYWIDIGTHTQYRRAQEEFPQRFMQTGADP